MTNPELKEALLQGYPVICRGIEYARVSAIIYRAFNGKIAVSAELMDCTGNSVTIAPAKDVQRRTT